MVVGSEMKAVVRISALLCSQHVLHVETQLACNEMTCFHEKKYFLSDNNLLCKTMSFMVLLILFPNMYFVLIILETKSLKP